MANVGFFTQDQVRSIFECLENPYSTQYYAVDPMGMIGSTNIISVGTEGQAFTQIIAWLTAMDQDSATRVIALTVKWEQVSSAEGKLDHGSVGDNAIAGIVFDFNKKRKRIQTLMQVYVPFFRLAEILARRAAGATDSISIPTMG